MNAQPRWQALFYTVLLLALAAAAFSASSYWLRLAATVAMYVTLASAWNIVGGFTGYPSFATAAFFGLGAYAGAIAQLKGMPMVASWLLAALLGAAFAYALGLALLRLRGHYFAVGSLVVAEVLREIVTAGGDFTGGGMGLNLPLLGGTPRAQGTIFLAAFALLAAATVACAALVVRSRFGAGLACIEQNEAAASMLGVHTTRWKALALAMLIPAAGRAHHSFEMFDIEKTVVLNGTVKEFQWTNPHCWIQLNVEQDGAVTEWSLEGVSINQLGRQGWKRDMIKAGDKVSISVHPLRNGKPGGQWLKVMDKDGKQLGTPGAPPR